jgi:hypothetical protein
VRARIHYSWLHHEQSRETLREQPGGEEKVGGSGAVSDAKDAAQIERFDCRTNVLSEVQEVVAIARGFVAGAVAAAVERINRVSGSKRARGLLPDLADEAGNRVSAAQAAWQS